MLRTSLPWITSAAMRAWYFPMWVSGARPLQSPTAYSQPPSTPVGAELIVDVDGASGLEPHRLESEIAGGGPAAGGDEQLVRNELRAVVEHGGDGATAVPLHACDAEADEDGDAVGLESGADLVARERLLAGEQPAGDLDHRHVAAEAPERLGQLDTDRATAEHEQAVRHLPGLGRAAVVPRLDVAEPGHRRDGGAGSRGEHDRPPGGE